MIAVIRIAGNVKKKEKVLETLDRLKLQKKYTCRLIDPKDRVRVGMARSAKDALTYGEIPEELEKELREKRGKEGKSVFFLHPPRGGLKKSSKLPYPKGVLGYNPDISKLLKRML